MTTRTTSARGARIALAGLASLLLFAVAPSAEAKTVTAKLRVLTPNRVLDPGTSYVVQDPITLATSPKADCFGPPGGSGARYTYEKPVALGLLGSAVKARGKLRPLLLTDQFGFGLGICGIGGAEAGSDSFWYFKHNHDEASVGADQVRVRNGDEVLFYLAPDNFPAPNPAELELRAPARAKAGRLFTAKVIEHSCITDQTTFETTCSSRPAEGASVRGAGGGPRTTDAGGRVELSSVRSAKLIATRGNDIPSERLEVCVARKLRKCAPRRGERIVGTSDADRVKGSGGDDVIRARGGADKIDLRKGGADRVDCGRGRDTVRLKRRDRDDKLAPNCERVRRR